MLCEAPRPFIRKLGGFIKIGELANWFAVPRIIHNRISRDSVVLQMLKFYRVSAAVSSNVDESKGIFNVAPMVGANLCNNKNRLAPSNFSLPNLNTLYGVAREHRRQFLKEFFSFPSHNIL